MARITLNGRLTDLITLTEAKSWLRVSNTTEDALILGVVAAAVAWANGYCKRVLPAGNYSAYSNVVEGIEAVVPNDLCKVEYMPLGSKVYSLVPAGTYGWSDCIVPGLVLLDAEYVLPGLAMRGDAVKVSYSAGYTMQTLPADVRMAILMKVSTLYDGRADENKRYETAAEHLLRPYKIMDVL